MLSCVIAVIFSCKCGLLTSQHVSCVILESHWCSSHLLRHLPKHSQMAQRTQKKNASKPYRVHNESEKGNDSHEEGPKADGAKRRSQSTAKCPKSWESITGICCRDSPTTTLKVEGSNGTTHSNVQDVVQNLHRPHKREQQLPSHGTFIIHRSAHTRAGQANRERKMQQCHILPSSWPCLVHSADCHRSAASAER